MALNPRQRWFVLEYIKDSNGSRAAIAAGYAEKSARITASKLLTNTNIQKEISELTKERRRANILEYDEACEILSKIAKGTIEGCLDDDGNFDIKSIPPGSLSQIEYDPETGDIKKFKIEDRVKAIERLSKMRGWDKPEHLHHSGYIADRPPCELTDDELAAIAASGNK
jgi:phage terminase small subunit